MKLKKQSDGGASKILGALLVCLALSYCLGTLAFLRFLSIPYLRSFLGFFLLSIKELFTNEIEKLLPETKATEKKRKKRNGEPGMEMNRRKPAHLNKSST